MGVRQEHVTLSAAVRPTSHEHVELIRVVADRAAQVTWTPELLDLLLDELEIDDDFGWLRAPGLPKHRYPQVVALALLCRHDSRVDDFVDTARRLGLLASRGRRRTRRLIARPRLGIHAVASDDEIAVNCGCCGRALQMRVEALRGLRTIDCEDCATLAGRRRARAPAPAGPVGEVRPARSLLALTIRPESPRPRARHRERRGSR